MKPTSWAYRVALICWAVPLILGVSIFVAWLLTRREWLMIAGIATIGGGVALLPIGALVLAHFYATGWDDPRRRSSTLIGVVLLLSNVPVAGLVCTAAASIYTAYVVVIRNESGRGIEDVRVVGGGCTVSFGSIPAGVSVQRRFWIRQDGELRLHGGSGGVATNEVIEGYVTSGQGGRKTATIHPDGTITVGRRLLIIPPCRLGEGLRPG